MSTAQADVSMESGRAKGMLVWKSCRVTRRPADAEKIIPGPRSAMSHTAFPRAETAEVRIDDTDRGDDCTGRLDGDAASLQGAQPRLGRQDVRTRRHSLTAAR